MDKTEIQDKIENILNQSRVGVLSTAHHNVPNSRYMMFYNDDLTLYTNKNKQKRQKLKNSEIIRKHILLGYNETTNHSF